MDRCLLEHRDQAGELIVEHVCAKCGKVDILIRCMEDEFSKENPNLGLHNRNFLSELCIGHVYEIVRLLDERKFAPTHAEFVRLFKDLTLVRIPLEKHEIAKDNKIKEPLKLIRHPPTNAPTDVYEYAREGQTRSHIMSHGASVRGSSVWQGLDVTSTPPQEWWIERRDLSDRILAIWGKAEPEISKAEPKAMTTP